LLRKDERLQLAFWVGYAFGAPKELSKVNDAFLNELRDDPKIVPPDPAELRRAMHEFGQKMVTKLNLPTEP
jgi:hypothetical protein